MALRLTLTDGSGVSGLQAVFGAFIDTSVAATAADAAAAAASALQASSSASDASTSASAASGSASAAAASATAASGSASAASTSASAAAGSATSASTSATNSANSATAAAGSATAAGNSASAAAGSASAAATSASNAAATLANALTKANNLSDVANAATAAHNLGLGTADTPTFTGIKLSGSTVHGILLGQAGSGVTSIGPSATGGLPLLNNVGADPSYGVLGVVGGGTGRNTLTAHSLLVGNGTTAPNLVAPSTAGQALISAGAAADPVFGFPTGTLLNIQVLTSSGTYNPIDTTNTKSVIVELQGGGAGSAGLQANGSSLASISGSGSTGGFVRHRFTTGFSGVAYTVGAAGAAGTSGGGVGGNGGNTTWGSLTAGGALGAGNNNNITNGGAGGGTPGSASGGNIINAPGHLSSTLSWVISSAGLIIPTATNPSDFFGMKYGFGGAGVGTGGSAGAIPGNPGGAGVIIAYEYA